MKRNKKLVHESIDEVKICTSKSFHCKQTTNPDHKNKLLLLFYIIFDYFPNTLVLITRCFS